VRFIEKVLSWAGIVLLAGCESPGPSSTPATVAGAGAQSARVAGATIPPPPAPSGRARDWPEYKLRAARRIQLANPAETFSGPLPDPLQSIPVLEVNLNRDGSVRDIRVLRTPRQSPQTIDMAMRAVQRAAPFEPVGHLPRPWQFNETFLYNEDFKFQLRSLVEATP
jgi:hypothetical protein